MRGPFHDFFELILTSLFDYILDSIYKGQGFYAAAAEKGFELLLHDRSSSSAFNYLLMILPMV